MNKGRHRAISTSSLLCIFADGSHLSGNSSCPVSRPHKRRAADDLGSQGPGGAAVYLYREETTDDNLHFHSYRERIKVLTEKGKELATVRIPYEHGEFKVTDIQGRTIHADGTIIPLTAKPSDLVDFKSKNYQVNPMVFT